MSQLLLWLLLQTYRHLAATEEGKNTERSSDPYTYVEREREKTRVGASEKERARENTGRKGQQNKKDAKPSIAIEAAPRKWQSRSKSLLRLAD